MEYFKGDYGISLPPDYFWRLSAGLKVDSWILITSRGGGVQGISDV